MFASLTARTVLSIVLILFTVFAGIVLHKSGKPYNHIIFAIHKLTTVVCVVLLIKMIIPYVNNHELNILTIILIMLSAISILGLIVSGGAMSLNKSPELMLTIHRVSTFVFLLTISGLFYTFYQNEN